MNGGKLVQDCTNHAIGFTHGIINSDGVCYDITSTHHQMQYPYNIDRNNYDVLYIAETLRSRHYKGGSIDIDIIQEKGEPEIVLYHTPDLPKCLAIQGHPEMMFKVAPVIGMLNELLDSVINNK
jgi:hypothetical protein